VLNQRPGIAWPGVGAVFLLLIRWGPTHALRTWWGIVLLGALIAIGVMALRHQTLRELPGADDHEAAASPPTPAPDAQPRPTGRSPAEELAQLGALRSAGTITNDEFDRARQIALSYRVEAARSCCSGLEHVPAGAADTGRHPRADAQQPVCHGVCSLPRSGGRSLLGLLQKSASRPLT
jgi:hypothetical protein